MNLVRAFVFNFEHLNILRDSTGRPSEKLLRFAFSTIFCFPLPASRYITELNRTSELTIIIVCTFYELPFSISTILIYYETQSKIQVNTYCHLNLLRAFVFNSERLDILRVSIGHRSKKLLSFEFAQCFCFQFRACRYTTGLNRTFQ